MSVLEIFLITMGVFFGLNILFLIAIKIWEIYDNNIVKINNKRQEKIYKKRMFYGKFYILYVYYNNKEYVSIETKNKIYIGKITKINKRYLKVWSYNKKIKIKDIKEYLLIERSQNEKMYSLRIVEKV